MKKAAQDSRNVQETSTKDTTACYETVLMEPGSPWMGILGAMTTNAPMPRRSSGEECLHDEDADGTACQSKADGHWNPI